MRTEKSVLARPNRTMLDANVEVLRMVMELVYAAFVPGVILANSARPGTPGTPLKDAAVAGRGRAATGSGDRCPAGPQALLESSQRTTSAQQQ